MRCPTECNHPICTAANHMLNMDRTLRSLEAWRRARRWFWLPWGIAWGFAVWRMDMFGWLLVVVIQGVEFGMSSQIERRLNELTILLSFQASDSFANTIRGWAEDQRKVAKVQTEHAAPLN